MSGRDAATLQRDFAGSLLGRGDPQAPRLPRRFAVHRNNVAASLGAALASRFPVAERIVGPVFFAAMARAYLLAHPPRSPVLFTYGDDLADFVEGFEPAATVAYLPDIVRLEAARGRAYHASDAAPLAPSALSARSVESLSALTFELHPAAGVIRSIHPIVTIWAMNAGDRALAPIAPWVGEDALVTRPRLSVEVRALSSGGTVLLAALAKQVPFGVAIELATQAAPDFDLAANLVSMLEAGAFASIG